MDSLTHIFSGAVVGEAVLGRRYGKKAMALGAAVSNLPDIDVVANFFTDPATAALYHRGYTHSLFFALPAALLLAWLWRRPFRRHGVSPRRGLLFFVSSLLLHLTMDVTTCYGTGLLEPFSHTRFAINTLFILDPLFSLFFLVAFIVLLVRPLAVSGRRRVIRVSLGLATGYALLAGGVKLYVDRVAERSLEARALPYTDYMSTPAPLSILLWQVNARSGNGFYSGYYSLFDDADTMAFSRVPRNDLMLILFRKDPKVDRLKRFSQGYYCFTRSDGKVYFNDLRFGRVAGWMSDSSRFVFSYNIHQEDGAVSIIRRTGFGMPVRVAFEGLVRRIRSVPQPTD